MIPALVAAVAIKGGIIARTVVPAFDFVVSMRICMNGKPVGVLRSASSGPVLNSNIRQYPSPRTPLVTTEPTMAMGTFREA